MTSTIGLPCEGRRPELELSQAYEAGLYAQLELADTSPDDPTRPSSRPRPTGASGPGAR
jgi:hypothetical protein